MSDLTTYRGKTVLVTGDTGFKGSWLATWLMQLGANVVGYALPPAAPRDNFVVCGLADRIRHIDGDVRDHDALARTLHDARPEIVFHLAAQAVVLESYRDPRTTFDTNIMGVANILETVRHTPSVRAVVIVTSDKCYENHEHDRGYHEEDRLGGRDPYSASKGAAEIVASSMRRSFFEAPDAPAIATVRAGNVIGGGDWSAHRIVPDCMRALLAGEPIVLRNPGATRPWQHVLDALHGYLHLGAKLASGARQLAGGWNFGPAAGTAVPVRALVEAVIAAWGTGTYEVSGASDQPSESRYLQLSIEKARTQLGWQPRLSFDDTVRMTVDGYRAELDDRAALFAHRVNQIGTFGGRS